MNFRATNCPATNVPKQLKFELSSSEEECFVTYTKTKKGDYTMVLAVASQTVISISNIPEINLHIK